MNTAELYQPSEAYLRVATACPEVALADVSTNTDRIKELYEEAEASQVNVVTFPEMSVTGYTLGDLVQQTSLLDQAENALVDLAAATKQHQTALIVGLPLRVGNGLYNCAAFISKGQIRGIVPKSNLPTYNEFYEDRWFQAWNQENTSLRIGEQEVPFGRHMIFDVGGVECASEICEDLWVLDQPSVKLAQYGAKVIFNPSASPEQVSRETYRRNLVVGQSGRLIGGYVYAGCDPSESTAEIVMGGHQLISSNGELLAERKPFGEGRLMVADIDVDHIEFDRRKHHFETALGALVVDMQVKRSQESIVGRMEPTPFLPSNETQADRDERLRTALQIQAYGLAMRMRATHQDRLVLGLSGGLDSTLALVVACEAAKVLGKDPADMIHTLTMPGMASSDQTQNNAQKLAHGLNALNTVISIEDLSKIELLSLGHDGVTQDITYENVQARARTSLLFNYANKNNCMVLGTGDLSEIALGWCTYNGDQQSHYNVNASIPKTLVKHLVAYATKQPGYGEVSAILEDILDTPISPELTSTGSDGISQTTEDIIGPYELHDFFIYQLIRWSDKPAKIKYLAGQAFAGKYDDNEITKWFDVFIKRFSQSQFKRENMPNGPKVGSVSLSPRGDWRMPPDLYNAAIWQSK